MGRITVFLPTIVRPPLFMRSWLFSVFQGPKLWLLKGGRGLAIGGCATRVPPQGHHAPAVGAVPRAVPHRPALRALGPPPGRPVTSFIKRSRGGNNPPVVRGATINTDVGYCFLLAPLPTPPPTGWIAGKQLLKCGQSHPPLGEGKS